nr:uncharacterized protein LOC109766024 isoform X2 [Aegilops tauschii subsp. strangulata]
MAVLETPQRSCSHVKLVRWGMCMSSPWACSRCCWIWGGWGESREGEATFAALTGLVFKEVWLDGRRDKNEPLRTVEEQQLHPGHLFLLASCKNGLAKQSYAGHNTGVVRKPNSPAAKWQQRHEAALFLVLYSALN